MARSLSIFSRLQLKLVLEDEEETTEEATPPVPVALALEGPLVPAIGLALVRLDVSGGVSLAAAVIGSLVVSTGVGWVTYVILERPTLALFRRQPASARLTTIAS